MRVLTSRASGRTPEGPSNPAGNRNEPSGEFTEMKIALLLSPGPYFAEIVYISR
jgi:hypothetical protein